MGKKSLQINKYWIECDDCGVSSKSHESTGSNWGKLSSDEAVVTKQALKDGWISINYNLVKQGNKNHQWCSKWVCNECAEKYNCIEEMMTMRSKEDEDLLADSDFLQALKEM